MIALTRRRTGRSVPAAFRQPKVAQAAHTLIDLYYAAGGGRGIAFESRSWKPAKAALKRDTHGKCAYCEAPTDVVAYGDVEHFRPKSVYWWLAFCFDNYLYSCQICNQTHKGDRFPVTGAVLQSMVMPGRAPTGAARQALAVALTLDASVLTDTDIRRLWAAEDAHLIHPYLDDPEPLLAYEADVVNREVWIRSGGGDRADRFFQAAEVCLGLNREELRRHRYTMYRPFAALKLVLDRELQPELRQEVEVEVRTLQHAAEPFAGMRRYFARQWGLPGPP